MPWVRAKYSVTENPKRIIAAGSSYGGVGIIVTSQSKYYLIFIAALKMNQMIFPQFVAR